MLSIPRVLPPLPRHAADGGSSQPIVSLSSASDMSRPPPTPRAANSDCSARLSACDLGGSSPSSVSTDAFPAGAAARAGFTQPIVRASAVAPATRDVEKRRVGVDMVGPNVRTAPAPEERGQAKRGAVWASSRARRSSPPAPGAAFAAAPL